MPALFQTRDGGAELEELPGLRAAQGHLWQPGAGGMCLHTILLDPTNPRRIFIAISAAGAFRTDDGGETWRPINRGLKSAFEIPDPHGGGGPLRASHRAASRAARMCSSCKSIGT